MPWYQQLVMANELEPKLREQLNAALRAKDSQTANLIRMIMTKIMERRTAKGFSGDVDDVLVLDVIGSYKKQMEKARVDFANAGERGKEQLAELEFEVAWCAKWLPTQLTDAELRAAAAAAIAELPTKDPKMAGRILGGLKKQFGDRVDALQAKKIVDELMA